MKNSTGDDVRTGVTVTSLHEEELPGSKGTANFALKWVKDSKHVAYLNVVEIEKQLKSKSKNKIAGCYTADDDGQYVGLIAFDCRGLEVIDWQPEVYYKDEVNLTSITTVISVSERPHQAELLTIMAIIWC